MAPRSTNRSRARQNPKSRSLNAFAIASSQVSEKSAVAAHRLGQAPPKAGKRQQRKGGDDEDEDEEPRARKSRDDESIEGGSDSDGGQWKVGVDSDDESDIDSDEAMGESDEERFADFTFRGSSSTGKPKKSKGKPKEVDLGESEEEEGDESEEDGEGFIDLSEMMDRVETSSDDDQKTTKSNPKSKKRTAPEDSELDDDSPMSSTDDEPSDGDDSDTDSFTKFSEEEDTTPEDPKKLAALQTLISSLPSSTQPAAKRVRLDDPNEGKTPNEYNLSLSSNSQKLTLDDFLPSVSDPRLKKSLKVLADPTPADIKKSGVQGKLSAPLPKRQQNRLDRAAAYEKANETLDRWVGTVKSNREADHLHFPLANAPNAPIKASARLSTLTASNSTPLTALEATISSILKDSNMQDEKQIAEFETLKTNQLSIAEVQQRTAELRMTRELLYREELKAKRIKKIKSKAYHRVHKKERIRQEEAIEEALALERGGVPDEEETMERERKRAEERMTLRHKQSKWAKGMKESGRTIWDEEAVDGAVDMARRAEELTRRIRGKDVREGSEFESSSEEEEEDDPFNEEGVVMRERLLKDIAKAETFGEVATGGSRKLGGRLMGLKFMQNAEAARKKENDNALEELRKSLQDGDKTSSDESGSNAEATKKTSGRMAFKPTKKVETHILKNILKPDRSEFEEREEKSGSEQDEEDEVVAFVNKASAAFTALKNPFSQPKPTTGQSSGKHLPFDQREDDHGPISSGNPWLAKDSNTPLVQSKQQTLVPGKQERKGERTNRKLAKDRKSALKNPTENEEVEIDTNITLKAVPKKVMNPEDDGSDDEVNDTKINLIPAKGKKGTNNSQRELVKRAFAGDNVVADFVEEKKKIVEEDGDQTIDETLPGWGSWVGDGLEKPKWPKKKFLRKIKGVDKAKRKDAKLAKVIINEKRVKKNVKYNASNLPHPFETKQQYERSLRVPIGPEWATKATFQDSTMPRVIVKQGAVVEAISAPFK